MGVYVDECSGRFRSIKYVELLYEPIYSADEHVLIGYEVIGFLLGGNSYKIKDFIYDETATADLRLELQHFFVEEALKASLEQLKESRAYFYRVIRTC
ncbi:hypothetical protein [Streptomyces canarius]